MIRSRRSNGPRPRGSRRRGAWTSSSSGSSSTSRRRSSRSCSTGARRWGSTARPRPGSTSRAAAEIAVRAIVESADDARATVAVFDRAPTACASRSRSRGRTHVVLTRVERADFDGAAECLDDALGRLMRSRRAVPAARQLRVPHLRLPRLARARVASAAAPTSAPTSCRSSSRIRPGSAASRMCPGVLLPSLDVAERRASRPVRLTRRRDARAQRRQHEQRYARSRSASARPGWIPVTFAEPRRPRRSIAPSSRGPSDVAACCAGAMTVRAASTLAALARVRRARRLDAARAADVQIDHGHRPARRALRRRHPRDYHRRARRPSRRVQGGLLAVPGACVAVDERGRWRRRHTWRFDLQCLEPRCAPGPGARRVALAPSRVLHAGSRVSWRASRACRRAARDREAGRDSPSAPSCTRRRLRLRATASRRARRAPCSGRGRAGARAGRRGRSSCHSPGGAARRRASRSPTRSSARSRSCARRARVLARPPAGARPARAHAPPAGATARGPSRRRSRLVRARAGRRAHAAARRSRREDAVSSARIPLSGHPPSSAPRGGARRVIRVVLAAALVGLILVTALLARGRRPVLRCASYRGPRTRIVVLDLSASISSDTFNRIGETLDQLAATNGRYGLVVFSDVAYQALPPGTPSVAARALRALLQGARSARAGARSGAAGEPLDATRSAPARASRRASGSRSG